MILGKIKVDNEIFKYFEISYDPFYVTIAADNEKDIVDLFNNAKSIIVMDNDGLVIKAITGYCGVESSTVKYDFYLDNENKLQPVITITLKEIDVNKKLQSIEDAMKDTVPNETAMTLEEYRAYKIKQFGVECSKNIYAGVDVETSYGTEHFSATDEDQRDIKDLADAAMNAKVSLPYHADSSQCKVYSYQDIIKIYCEMKKLVLNETSYCNALNTYVREKLYTKEEIAAVKYGQEIADPTIKENMETVIAQGEAVMNAIAKQYLVADAENTESNSTDSAESDAEKE